MLKVINKKNNTLNYIGSFNSDICKSLDSLDACGCTGNGVC